MASTTDRLRTTRQVYRHRGGARSAGDIAYVVYVGILVAALAGVPAINAVAQALMVPPVARAVAAPGAGDVVALLSGSGLVAFAALGAARGPALLSPFLLTAVAGTDLPRRRTLRRPFVIATLAVVTGAVGTAGLLCSVLVRTDVATPESCARFTLAAAAFAVLTSVVWLAGQRLASPRAWNLAMVLLAATLLSWVLPALAVFTPWGWLGLMWPSRVPGSDPWWPPALLAVATLVAARFVPRLLDGLNGPVLMEQAQRWQAAGVAAGNADFSGALATYRARPRHGRWWRAVRHHRVPARFVVRDLTGALRTPGRLGVGTAFMLLGGFVAALAAAPSELPGWLPASAGAGVSYAAFGVVTDGFRHAADAAAAPALYRYSTAQLYGLHAIQPALWAAAWTTAGAGLALAAGAPLHALAGVAVLAVFLVAVRAYDSARGPMPPALLTPIPSPAGDLSGVLVLAWQADAVLIATITAAVTLPGTGGAAVTGTTVLVAATLAMVVLTRLRSRRL